jgi:cytochrome oxidase Cu insertion factor (SCO1/SenC/PrrC family)
MKSKNTKKYIVLIGILFLFPLSWVLFFGVMGKHHFNTLLYYDANHLEGSSDSLSHVMAPFQGVDENGHSFGLSHMQGGVWLACFYSLDDEHIAKITERLLNINFKYRDEPDISIVVFSTDPQSDSLQRVQAYLNGLTKYNVNQNKWKFVQLDSLNLQSIQKESFFIKDLSNEALYRLVDPSGHVRGMYGNTEYHMQSIIEDIALLKKEMDLKKFNKRHAQD